MTKSSHNYFYLSGEHSDVSSLLNLKPEHASHHLLFLFLYHFQHKTTKKAFQIACFQVGQWLMTI